MWSGSRRSLKLGKPKFILKQLPNANEDSAFPVGANEKLVCGQISLGSGPYLRYLLHTADLTKENYNRAIVDVTCPHG